MLYTIYKGADFMVSYGIQLDHMSRCLDQTVRVYRDAVRYLIDIAMLHYGDIKVLLPNDAQRYIEDLVHSTKQNTAIYPAFDHKFYKMPSYLRRNAISTANGKVIGYMELVSRWKSSGCKDRKPHMNFSQDMMPCFYRDNMFRQKDGGFQIKAYIRHDWVWLPVSMRKTDLDYIHKRCAGMKECAPVLRKAHHKYILQSAYQYDTKAVPKYRKDINVQHAVGVDLGINTDAVCVSMLRDGTVTGQKFINCPVEKDRLNTLLNVIKGAQQHGSRRNRKLWRYVNNYNREIAVKTASGIVGYAVREQADVIVFENLSGIKPAGSKRQRIALWRKRDIQRRTEAMAKRLGIRISYICAKNTSKLAFDGSGAVVRNQHDYSLCTFTTGKCYNCDLSASKNIGARYFIRAIKKSMPETAWLSVLAKVPELGTRTRCTLSTLISLSAVSTAHAA